MILKYPPIKQTFKIFSVFLTFIFVFSSYSQMFAATFTAGMSKRNAPGPFTAAPIVQGDWATVSGDSDTTSYARGSQVSGEFYTNYDATQGSIVLWVTPEWNGNDGIIHTLTFGTMQLSKGSDNNLNLYTAGGTLLASTSVSSWTAGTMYQVTARWDTDNSLDGTNYGSISINDSHTFGRTSSFTSTTGSTNYAGSYGATNPSNALVEGLTIYRRPLFDGTYGIDVGNGDEINQIYNSGTGKDPTLITGSWDVVFALPTNSSTGTLTTGTGNAWTHPHLSNLLYTSTTNTGGFMMNGTYTSDGWNPINDSGHNSLTFNGTNTYVGVSPNSAPTGNNTWTMEAWFKPAVNAKAPYLSNVVAMGTHTAAQRSAQLQATYNNVTFEAYLGPTLSYTPSSPFTQTWHHIAATYDGDKVRLYVDGVLRNTSNSTTLNLQSDTLYIGRNSNTDRYFEGLIDDVRIWNVARNAIEIADNMNSELAGNESGLVHYFKFNGGSGSTAADSTGSGQDGVITNATWISESPFSFNQSILLTSEKIFSGGYKTTSSAANQGIYYDKTVVAGNDWVIRALGNSDGTSIPKVILYDQTNGAEIGSLTGTNTSTRADPDVFIFTGEAPAGMTTLRVKLVNTQASGTTYWHQVEVLSNLISNPSLETGSGDPFTPTGWTTQNIDSGDVLQNSSDVHSGTYSLEFTNSFLASESVWYTPSLITNKYYTMGAWAKKLSGNDGQRLETPSLTCTFTCYQYATTGQVSLSVSNASWTNYSAVVRVVNNGFGRWGYGGSSLSLIQNELTDDFYTISLTDVSLTVTPASEANSTESTGIRVDGTDTYTETISDLSTTRGTISFDFTPRRNFDKNLVFQANPPIIIDLNRVDGVDRISLRQTSTTNLALQGYFNSTLITANWSTPTLNAGTTYDMQIIYQAGGNLVLKVDGAQVASATGVVAFSSPPTTAYMGSNYNGAFQYDGTFANLVFDSTAPSISLTPLSPDPNSDNTPTLSGTATEAIGTISSVEFQVDSTAGSWSACTANDATFDEASETFTCTTSALSNGSHTIYVRATDSNGNTTTSGSESTDSFTIDASVPTVILTPVSPDPTTDTTPSVLGTVTDTGGAVSSVEFQVDSTAESWTPCTSDDGSFDEVSEAFTCTSSTLADGSHTIYVRATDNASNVSANASDTFTTDATPPEEIELEDPDSKSYTSDSRPVFKWKETSDATSGLSSYEVEIDNGDEGDFSIEDIPISQTEDYETSKYKVSYSDNSISVYFKASLNWESDENNGKLREGRRIWTVKAIDNAGNEISASRTLFVDKTNPTFELPQINNTKYTGGSGTISTTDTTPTISGKIIDQLSGDSDENKVASGPEQTEIIIEKRGGLAYQPHTIYTINFGTPLYTCTGVSVPDDNKEQGCDKYRFFERTLENGLEPGLYKITLSGKDKVDNATEPLSLILNITTFDQIASPEEKELLEEKIKDLPVEEQEKAKEEMEITRAAEPGFFENLSSGMQNLLATLFNSIEQGFAWATEGIQSSFKVLSENLAYLGDTYAKLAQSAPEAIKAAMLAISKGVSTAYTWFNNTTLNTAYALKEGISNLAFSAGEKTQNVSEDAGHAIVKFGYLFVDEPTTISNVRVSKLDSTSATISWSTNHPANGKVNWGLTEDYGQDIQSEERITNHEFTIDKLTPNTTYYYEVMSHNKNYVYDANHTFVTPSGDQ